MVTDIEETKVATIILRDLALFNKAAIFFEDKIEPVIHSAIADLLADWLRTKKWQGQYSATEDLSGLWVRPMEWAGTNGRAFATFKFERKDSDSRSYQIADLFDVGQTNFGFRFRAGYYWFGTKWNWNKFINDTPELVEAAVSKGWTHEGKGEFFKPVKLDPSLLAISWEKNSWTEALSPLMLALDGLEADLEIFQKIIDEARVRSPATD